MESVFSHPSNRILSQVLNRQTDRQVEISDLGGPRQTVVLQNVILAFRNVTLLDCMLDLRFSCPLPHTLPADKLPDVEIRIKTRLSRPLFLYLSREAESARCRSGEEKKSSRAL